MSGLRSITSGRTCLLCMLVGFAWFAHLFLCPSRVFGADPPALLRKIDPPENWDIPANADRWLRASIEDWNRFQQSLVNGGEPAPAPVIVNAVYRSTFDGNSLTEGEFEWKIDRIRAEPGFVSLGRSSLAVSQLKWPTNDAVHGITSTGDWVLWSETTENQLKGRWSHRGETKLTTVLFEMTLPRALSSHLEIRVPSGWEARVLGGIGPETPGESSPDGSVWKFELGRQQTFQLKLSRPTPADSPRILVRENTVYGLNNTDDLIRLQTDLDCTVAGAKNADLLLAVPKTLRVFNVLLGNELPLTFKRELGSEEDQVRIPLRSLTPGQRVTLRILGESQRRSDRSFSVPRLRPVNAMFQEGRVRLAVFRPLEVRAVESSGLRQTQLTEEEGQEIRSYEILSNDCQLSLQVGEPTALLQGEILFIADMRGESPTSRVRMRLSTREGELYSPQMQIPPGWDLISVEMAETSDIVPTAWQVTEGPSGDGLLDLELRQPIRPDRDCTLVMEFKAVALKPGTPRRLPIPCLNETQSCYVRGVVWDNWPWELDEASAGSVELDGTAADEELKQAVKWTRPEDSRAVPTGVRITGYNSQHKTLFRAEGSTPVDPVNLAGESDVTQSAPLLCANLELETRTSRVGKSHPHRAIFQFSRPAIPSEFRLALPQEGGLTRMIADEKEISFVRHGGDIILDPAAKPFSELVLEYRTEASPGWIVSRDEVVFPQLTCFVTEFAWHLVLDPERMLYRLPLTAAVSPREQPQTWERLLGPLARHSGESLFNPLSRADWSDLFNGTSRANSTSRSNDAWFVAAETPQQVIMKTWNLDVSHGLAWCGMLGSLVCGISLRRARRSWFRQSWIYLCGVWLVVAVFVAEPYAPIAGGAFLGSLLAIIVPRRFALGSDFLAEPHSMPHSPSGSAAIITGGLIAFGINLLSPAGQGQETTPPPELVYFEIEEAGTSLVVFDAAYRSQWDAWRELETGPAWLLKSSRYDVQPDTSGPPRITATYEIVVFGDSHPALLKLPLSGVSLDQVEGLIDGQPVRLIPAADRTGFLLPLAVDKNEKSSAPPAAEAGSSRPVVTRTITLKFRPLPLATNDDQESFSANIPPLPESVVVLDSERWRLTLDPHGAPIKTAPGLVRELGPIGHLDISSGSSALSPRENLTDVQLRTLVECGPLGARVQIGALAVVPDPLSPTEYTLTLPAGLLIQSIVGPSLDQSEVGYSDKETLVTLRLRPIGMAERNPIEITAFLPVTSTGFQLAPPRWKPDRAKQPAPSPADSTPDTRFEKSLVGVVAKPGFRIVDTSTRTTISPISPTTFSDSLFTGLVWNAPDMAWTCRDSTGPSWALETIASTGRGTLSQSITLKAPQSEWRLDAKISTAQGVPFEHVFTIDERIEIHRATVQQDGADRLLRWTRTGNQLRLSIRDGQPGTQTIQIEGAITQGTGPWAPPECEYLSGQTIDSSVMIRNSSQVASTLRWSDSTTRLRPNAEQSDEEVRYRPGTPAAPLTIRVDPVVEERSARIWIDLIPQRDRSWQVTLRAQLKENLPFVAPVRIVWDQPGLSEFRPTNSRDNVRQTSSGKGLLLLQSTKPTELSLSATIDQATGSHQPIRLPQLSGVVWSEIWVSLPRGAGYRPARSSSALLSSAPSSWPAAWTENLASSREDLYSCSAKEVLIETTSSEPLVRPVRAESLIWMEGAENPASPIRVGVTKYLLIAERDITLEIPEATRSMIRAVAIDGRTQAVDATIRVPSRSNDLSHEVVVWWQSGSDTPELAPRDLIRFPGSPDFPHWTGVVPPHHQVLLELWGRRTPLLHEFWLDRSESLLKAADEFRGAPWSVDGPLLHQLADSRDELHQANQLTPAESERQDQIDRRWKSFSQSGGSISSPPFMATTEMHYSGLDAILALCGESRSLWLSSDMHPYSGPRLLDRRWAIIITAALASLVSLLVLTWIVSIFRRLDLAEKLAAHPNSTMVVLGLIWWAFLSPSVLGLGLALFGGWLSIRDRTQATRIQTTAPANGPA